MSLKEQDVLDRLKTALGDATANCMTLSTASWRGIPYDNLRNNLALIEGCCRQMAAYRDDARWLPFGIWAANIHQRAGDWLRGYVHNGVVVIWTQGHINQAFVKLAAELKIIHDALDTIATARTGKVGMILPETPAEERREGRPALDHRSKRQRGLILPAKYAKRG